MDFRSDNIATVANEIMAAIAKANQGPASGYGEDGISEGLEFKYSQLFEQDVKVFPVLTGTIANALALSVLCPPYGAIYAEENSHIMQDECGAPELFTGGAKIIPIRGKAGKIEANQLQKCIADSASGFVHAVQPSVLSITQVSEFGAVYSADEISELCEIAHGANLSVHMDGARFANAVVALESGNKPESAADLTWRSGVDILSFGATKNGALGAEAIILFRPELSQEMAFRHKRAGQLASKMRFISAQLDAYIEQGLWLKMARHSNNMCSILAKNLRTCSDVKLVNYGGANELFIRLPGRWVFALRREGIKFYDWPETVSAVSDKPCTIRLVTRHDTTEKEVTTLVDAVKQLAI